MLSDIKIPGSMNISCSTCDSCLPKQDNTNIHQCSILNKDINKQYGNKRLNEHLLCEGRNWKKKEFGTSSKRGSLYHKNKGHK